MNGNTGFPLERVRTETPACNSLIHFNNAGASLQPKQVSDSIQAHLALEQKIGGYEAAAAEAARISTMPSPDCSAQNHMRSHTSKMRRAPGTWRFMRYHSKPVIGY